MLKSLPPNSIVIFPDGNKMCAVQLNFENLQESPSGFGDDFRKAVESLRLDLVIQRAELAKRIDQLDNLIDAIYQAQGRGSIAIAARRASRQVATWPKWKQDILRDSGKATNDTPRTPICNNDDDVF